MGLQPCPAIFDERQADWRNGAVVYQVIVDRFAPPTDLEGKQSLYSPPRRWRAWAETPDRGPFLPDVQVWSQELDFWGGDLTSLRGQLDYIHGLGVDVLYLNPIHKAYTNHKYDAEDYFEVSPEYGTRADVRALAEACHARGMKLVLDGVFNHMGRNSAWFRAAMQDPNSPYRDWFFIDPKYKLGYRAWADVANLPELRVENPQVQARIFGDADSVVQGYLRDGVDGWRLDVAFDLGFDILTKLTAAAHAAKPGSLVVGEIWNYPEQWSPAVDAVMNFYYRELIFALAQRDLTGAHAGRLIKRMIADTGLEPVLKSWIVLDNHDTERLQDRLPELWRRRLAQVLQFTLPGSPNLYYGVEVGMAGGKDPANRAPMRWDLVRDDNPDLQWMKKLLALRRGRRALRVGDFRLLDSEKLLAFLRLTDHVAETVIVVANPTGRAIKEVLPVRDSRLMNDSQLRDALSDAATAVHSGTLCVSVPAQTIRVFVPVIPDTHEYSAYKRIP
ncbi:MAG TPA: glycoside hydrolase family 13 protein [Phycisphaerae bacterium]|nr:glycoside hydrolase family 13 protein [Phycisphaerae bacterium]HNU45633.1 glycoside hydrolase family 13 protein [Phycisphaerae bacterium]